MNYTSKETPRERIKRLNRQIEYWSCFGHTRFCKQDICTFCQHFRVWDGEPDCFVKWGNNTGDIVLHCRKFKAVPQWKYRCENLLSDLMSDIIKDLTGRLTLANAERNQAVLGVESMSERQALGGE